MRLTRSSAMSGILTIVLSAGLLVGYGSALAKKPGSKVFSIVEGRVSYLYQPYNECPQTSSRVPVEGAKVSVRRRDGSGSATARTDRSGHYVISLRGRGPIGGFVALESQRLVITPPRDNSAYYFPFAHLHEGMGNDMVLKGLGPAGVANLWRVLGQGADAGARMAGVRNLPKLYVRWAYTRDFNVIANPEFRQTVGYDGKQLIVGRRGAAWEPWMLLHEYGHHVLNSVAEPGPRGGGEHERTASYPARPGLAYQEGFAHAFAAAVIGQDGSLSLNCGKTDRVDLSTRPVTPKYADPTEAQYNELAAGAVLWQTARLIGQGKAQAGLAMILQAAKAYRYGGHHPWTVRQLRDAITRANLARGDSNLDTGIYQIFQGQDISWGFSIAAGLTPGIPWADDSPEWTHGDERVVLTIHGPGAYDGCSTGTGELTSTERQGGVSYSTRDDCSPVPGSRGGTIFLHYPYLADQSHLDGPYTVTATYYCKPRLLSEGEVCPSSHSAQLGVTRDSGAPQYPGATLFYPEVQFTVTLNQATPVLRFDPTIERGGTGASGVTEECTVLINYDTACSR